MIEEKLKWIDTALEKVTNGAFGICEECGCFIGIERLMAKPESRYCITCRSLMESNGKY